MPRTSIAVASALAALIAFPAFGSDAAWGHAPRTHACPTFTGPGDNVVHSYDSRVANVSCATGKKVVETCRTDGTKCRVGRSTWRCHGRIPGHERCTSGRRVASINWLD